VKISEPLRGTVLVVDDEPGVRALARRILEGGGYDVVEAGDGAEALTVIAGRARVDFLMADLDMPVMRGEEMTTKIRQLRPDLKVLYVTAHSEQLFKQRPELIEGEAFLDKPFTVRGLLEAVSLLKVGYITEPPAPPPAGVARLWHAITGKKRRS
jgi:two-component system, cell cycle sensor histidine kinase and response regulator CckA